MHQKIILLLVGLLLVIIVMSTFISFRSQKKLSSPLPSEETQQADNLPSETLKEYSDPSGFSFYYPDNLSPHKNETEDETKYTDILLTAKDVAGALKLEISDTKLLSIGDWLKTQNITTESGLKETKLGELSAQEIRTKDTRTLVAIDKGILFTIHFSLNGQEAFWTKAYDTIRETFSFAQPPSQINTSQTSGDSSDDVSFEGEEVVE